MLEGADLQSGGEGTTLALLLWAVGRVLVAMNVEGVNVAVAVKQQGWRWKAVEGMGQAGRQNVDRGEGHLEEEAECINIKQV